MLGNVLVALTFFYVVGAGGTGRWAVTFRWVLIGATVGCLVGNLAAKGLSGAASGPVESPFNRSNVENCRALCAPRAVYSCCTTAQCVCDGCEEQRPDGGS